MVAGLIHRLLFPTLVTMIVGSVWIVGWSQALVADVDRGYLAPLAVPGHAAQISDSDASNREANRQESDSSLHKVLLEHDQVIRVR
jgi:hypothetical protein